MIGRAFYEQWEENRKEKKMREEAELIQLAMKLASEKHEEWVEWADNGRDEATRPEPPECPKSLDNIRD